MRAVHLRMVKLKGNGQIVAQQLSFVTAPEKKGIVEDPAVHTDRAIDVRIRIAEVPITMQASDKS